MPTININTNNKWEIQKIEIIKCRDCKYYAHDDFGTGEKYWCTHFVNTNTDGLLMVCEDDFCSFGVRKDDSN